MANPGYPMQPQPPPMGGMPPMGPPMGAMTGPGAMRPMRQGTSKAVPVVVSAGLAVGVFCGLLFGLGTGDDEAIAAPSESGQEGSADTPGVLMAKPSTADPSASPATPPADGSAAPVASGSAAPAAGPGAEAGSAAPAIRMVKVIIAINPEAAAQVAKITINGKDVAATSELELGDAPKKKVAIVIKAAGYRDYTYDGEVEADADIKKFEFDMQKKPKPAGNLPRPENPGGKKPGNGKKPGGGLIDI